MAGDERVRHCAECNLNVYNLAAMTRREAAQFLLEHQGQRMCLRLYRRADGTFLTRDCPWGLRALRRRVSRMAGAVLSTILSIGAAAAQSIPTPGPKEGTQSQEQSSGIKIQVVDERGAVLPGATVVLTRAQGKIRSQVRGATDSMGVLQLHTLPAGDYSLAVLLSGFIPGKKSITLEPQKTVNLDLKLKADPKAFTEVEVGGVEVSLTQMDSSVTNTFPMEPAPAMGRSGPPSPLQR